VSAPRQHGGVSSAEPTYDFPNPLATTLTWCLAWHPWKTCSCKKCLSMHLVVYHFMFLFPLFLHLFHITFPPFSSLVLKDKVPGTTPWMDMYSNKVIPDRLHNRNGPAHGWSQHLEEGTK
jgi:hypothetical protein